MQEEAQDGGGEEEAPNDDDEDEEAPETAGSPTSAYRPWSAHALVRFWDPAGAAGPSSPGAPRGETGPAGAGRADLIVRVKQVQRQGGGPAWHRYCARYGRRTFDPRQHDDDFMRTFLDNLK